MSSPVALLIFNRPSETRLVLEAIHRARPSKLLVVADGPRPGRDGEADRCAAARAVIGQFDWECEVLRNYSDVNLGCGQRVASGLDWVFDNVPEAIILEDDCLPHASFFPFCNALLERYRHEERVMHIGGNNFGVDERGFGESSYLFTGMAQVWGWASWRRAWRNYDFELKDWPEFRRSGRLSGLPLTPRQRALQARRWDAVRSGRVDTWDFQWQFCLLSRRGLAAVPRVNLVTNVGFAADATHTTDIDSDKANLPTRELPLPIAHPTALEASQSLNRQFANRMLERSMLGGAIDLGRHLLSGWRAT